MTSVSSGDLSYKSYHHMQKLRRLNQTQTHTLDSIFHIMTIKVCIGFPQQCFNLLYDTGMMYTVIGDANTKAKFSHLFNGTKSQTFRSSRNKELTSLPYRSGVFHAREVCDYTLLENMRKPQYTFNFLLAFNTSMEFDFDGIFGLGMLYPRKEFLNNFNTRFSFLEYLKLNKVIKKKIFAHEYINRTYGKFYIDEKPKSMGKFYPECPARVFVTNMFKWQCQMNYMALSNGKVFSEINSILAFDTGYVDIRGPEEQGNVLFEEFINISGRKCKIEEQRIEKGDESLSLKKLICPESISISKFPDVHFILYQFQLTLFRYDMFRLVEIEGKRQLICKIILSSNYTYWNIGEPVLKNYDMIFDYEEFTVGVKENINYYGESWIGVIILCILLIGLIALGIYIYINRKRIFSKGLKSQEIENFKQREPFSGSELNTEN